MLTIAPLPTQGYELDESLHGLTMELLPDNPTAV